MSPPPPPFLPPSSYLHLLTIFPTYVEEHPLSKCICNAFLKFIFDEFTVPTAIRQDFPKWSRHIISNSFRIAAPDSIIHPSHEFVCEPPAAIASVQYMFQTVKEPGSGEICVALHVGAYDSLLFVEHPLYLPRWVDGYFQQLDLTSEFIAPPPTLALFLKMFRLKCSKVTCRKQLSLKWLLKRKLRTKPHTKHFLPRNSHRQKL